jgi:tetratricopeptide (TPR) repeat protein
MKKFLIILILLITFSEILLSADPVALKYYQYAVMYHKKNDFKNALTYYNASIKKDKKFWQAWLGLGICYYNMKKYRNAQLIFKYVLMLKPGEQTATKYYNMLSGIKDSKNSIADKKDSGKKTKGDMMWRSAILPGLGQFYNGEIVKGYAYSIIYFASIGGIIKFTIDQREAVSDYENTNYDFENKYKIAQEATVKTYIPIAIAGVVWALSIFDAYLTGADDVSGQKLGEFEMKDKNTIAFVMKKSF